jgi:hypothetical protein
MHLSFTRRLSRIVCGGLLALTLLTGVIIHDAANDFPPGPTKTAGAILAGVIINDATDDGGTPFNPQPDPPGKTASIIVHDGVIIQG